MHIKARNDDSYAIPTMHGGVDAVKPYVDEFIEYAKQHVLKRIFLENLQFKFKYINEKSSVKCFE